MSTPDRKAMLDHDRRGLSNRRQRVLLSLSRSGVYRPQRGSRRIEPTAVLQFQGGVEAEEIGGADRVVGPCHGLRFVDDVGKGEVVFLGEVLHLLGCVLGIAHVVVGHDRDYADSALL
jgi:hypothetical protein